MRKGGAVSSHCGIRDRFGKRRQAGGLSQDVSMTLEDAGTMQLPHRASVVACSGGLHHTQ